MLACVGCEWHIRTNDERSLGKELYVDRYDQLESRYLSTGDIAALQQMNTEYPNETRLLLENVLQLGPATDPDMKTKLLLFFQDSTLQQLIRDVEREYADMSDVVQQLSEAFSRLTDMLPGVEIPHVYTQIGSLDQSIVAGRGSLGISLDKYLGADYPLYIRYDYSDRQRSMMTRSFIVPDCIGFYLLSIFPLSESDTTQSARDEHIAKIQYVVNEALGYRQFDSPQVRMIESKVAGMKGRAVEKLLR